MNAKVIIMSETLPAEIASLVKAAPLPESYEAAKRAIAECERVDECADWADKAAAIASYARQADDRELELCARRIRLRATRRCGELLRTFDARGGDRRSKTVVPLNFDRRPRKAVAEEAGLSEHKVRTAVDIAAIPPDEFEAAVESDHPPGTEVLARWLRRKGDHPHDDVRAVTRRSLAEISKSVAAVNAAEALLKFERNATECGVEMIVEILRARKNCSGCDARSASPSASTVRSMKRAIGGIRCCGAGDRP
jgi:hypothetical protein